MNYFELSRQISVYALLAMTAALTFSSALVEISFVIAMIGWFLWRFHQKSLQPLEGPGIYQWSFYIFVGLCIASWFWSENRDASFRGVFKVLQQTLIFFMAADLFSVKNRMRLFEKVFVIVCLVVGCNGLFQYVTGTDFIRGIEAPESHSGLRITAAFKSYGLLASFLVISIPVLIGMFFRARIRESGWKTQLGYGLLIALLLMLLYWTRSRGAFLAILSGGFFLIILRRRLKHFLILVGVVGVILFLMPREMVFHFDGQMKEQSVIERLHLWQRAVHVIEAKPLTGTGINTYASTHAKYDKTDSWRVKDYYAHNGYLQLAAEVGLPALFFFFVFLFLFFLLSWKHYCSLDHEPDAAVQVGILVGVLNFLAFTCVDTIFHNAIAVMFFWLFLGVSWAYQCMDNS